MTHLVSALHLAVGFIGIVLALLALIESTRSARLAAHRRFGLSLTALVLTGAAHYVVFGLRRSGQSPGADGPQLAALALAFAPLAVFSWLRVEAYLDHAGDRFHEGRPGWISVLPSVVACGAGAVLVTAWLRPPMVESGPEAVALRWFGLLPTLLLVVLTLAIGWSLMRGQQTRRAVLGGWSLSGLAITLIFPTTAVAYATHILTVRPTLLSSLVDWVAVPAAAWFWLESRRLTRSADRSAYRLTVTVPAQHSKRPAPWAAGERGGPGVR